jgi:NAD-dependent dihydropyrimidine dehydrogenase PreA subunit
MAHVITDACTKEAACAEACPSECIHPGKSEAGFGDVPQLYINPDECLDCGTCIPTCPSNAIFPDVELPEDKKGFIQINADYYKK